VTQKVALQTSWRPVGACVPFADVLQGCTHCAVLASSAIIAHMCHGGNIRVVSAVWELYSGEALYEGMTVGQVLYAVVYDAKRPSIPDGCPPEYAALMRDCWKGEPTDRWVHPASGQISQWT
jgi:hypothetical protein